MEGKNIYEPKFVEKLFDKMSGSYSKVNYITSIGFSSRWRKQCVDAVQIEKGKVKTRKNNILITTLNCLKRTYLIIA